MQQDHNEGSAHPNFAVSSRLGHAGAAAKDLDLALSRWRLALGITILVLALVLSSCTGLFTLFFFGVGGYEVHDVASDIPVVVCEREGPCVNMLTSGSAPVRHGVSFPFDEGGVMIRLGFANGPKCVAFDLPSERFERVIYHVREGVPEMCITWIGGICEPARAAWACP